MKLHRDRALHRTGRQRTDAVVIIAPGHQPYCAVSGGVFTVDKTLSAPISA